MNKRIEKEINYLKENQIPGVKLDSFDKNNQTLFFTIQGPQGSLYEGGEYKFSLRFPDNYPFKCPGSYSCYSEIIHPMIKEESCLCGYEQNWVPTNQISCIFEYIQNLLINVKEKIEHLKAIKKDHPKAMGCYSYDQPCLTNSYEDFEKSVKIQIENYKKTLQNIPQEQIQH